ncbi:MAG: FAD-binding protein [Gemmatimonadota bacterium]|nr:FAD-binding protein [Gemmatimonadota bacterium]MDH4350054.1 FAD-binding protein [Gemmatimonadota bacterium]MDH5196804.1 FAD-binding protein [Gemmatimonadota bacterium]
MSIASQALDAIAGVVGPRWVRGDQASRETYASDGLSTLHALPGAVVLPGSRDELLRVVRILAHHGVPFVARGAGTGLSGGAVANADAVVLGLTRLTRILDLDPENRRAVVEPGVINTRLSKAAAPYGLHYAPDPSSQTACTVGGNVAENAGGPHCLKYGVTTQHVLALEVVLPSGDVVELGSPGGEPWGPDLVGVFVGSEGTFGIATRITVRLTPLPTAVRTLLADFDSLRAAGEAVSAIIASGIVPAALEMMDGTCVRVVEASIYRAGYPTDAAAVLLVEVDGRDETAVADLAEAAAAHLRRAGARSVRSAREAAERERLWQGRKKTFGALGRLSPDLVVQDAVVPRSALPDVLEAISAIAARYGVTVGNVFHAGDGNLHPNITFDRRDADQRHRVQRAAAEMMQVCIAAGGTITGEHGVGIDKLRYMADLFDPSTLGAMRAVRRVFDPAERANPGKVIPVRSCREWSGSFGHRADASVVPAVTAEPAS